MRYIHLILSLTLISLFAVMPTRATDMPSTTKCEAAYTAIRTTATNGVFTSLPLNTDNGLFIIPDDITGGIEITVPWAGSAFVATAVAHEMQSHLVFYMQGNQLQTAILSGNAKSCQIWTPAPQSRPITIDDLPLEILWEIRFNQVNFLSGDSTLTQQQRSAVTHQPEGKLRKTILAFGRTN